MSENVIELMVEALENHFDKDIVCVQPEEEQYRFVLGMGETVMLVDPSNKEFTPVKRGDPMTYMDLKKFLKGIKLSYRSRSI